MSADDNPRHRLVGVTLDERTWASARPTSSTSGLSPIYDLIEQNHFELPERDDGPYALNITLIERKLSLDIQREDGTTLITHLLSLTPFQPDHSRLCHGLRQLLRRDPHLEPGTDRGHRHGAARPARRGGLGARGRLEGRSAQSRHRETPVHADLRLHWKG